MTTDRDAKVPAELRQWAAELLKTPVDVPIDQARAAVARRLMEWDFAPPDRWQHAAELLAHSVADITVADSLRESDPRPPLEHSVLVGRERPLAEVEHRLRQQVEDFAARFFTLAPGDRSRAWHGLRLRCSPFPMLLNRLDWLERGLAATPADAEVGLERDGVNPQQPTAQLARELAEMFVLPAAERAVRRHQRVEHKWGGLVQWERAIRRLRTEHPAVAALDSEYLDRILALREQDRQRAKLAKANRKQQAAAVRQAKGSLLEGNAWKYALAFWVILGIVRAIGNNPSTPRRLPSTNYPSSFPSYSTSPNLGLPPENKVAEDILRQIRQLSDDGDTQVEYRDGRFVIVRRRAAPATPDVASAAPSLDGAADVSLPPLPSPTELP